MKSYAGSTLGWFFVKVLEPLFCEIGKHDNYSLLLTIFKLKRLLNNINKTEK